MQVRALKRFNDGWARRLRQVGEVFEVPQERFEYLNSTGLGVLVEEVKEGPGGSDLNNMTKKELVDYGKNQGVDLDDRMTKAEMIEKLGELGAGADGDSDDSGAGEGSDRADVDS